MQPRRTIVLALVVLLAAGYGMLAAAARAFAAETAPIFLSDLTPTFVKNGLGPMERDRHNGGATAGDGGPIVLNGKGYAKGLGVNAFAEVHYALGGRYTSFTADVGIDDSCGSAGSATAEVHLDGRAVKVTPVLRATSATVTVTVNVTGKSSLELVTGTAGDGNTCDRVDWAGARLTGSPPPTSSTTASSTTTTTTTTTTTSSTTTPPTTTPSSPPPTTAPTTSTYLSDRTPTFVKNGLGPMERDRHNGGATAGDGGPIVLNSKPYAKGLGVNAFAEVHYALGSRYTSFTADVGIDDSCGSAGSATAEVHLDGKAVKATPVLRAASATVTLTVNVTGKSDLKLVTGTGGDGNTCDRVDWAGARLTALATTTTTAPATTAPPTTAPPTTVPPDPSDPLRFEDTTAASGVGGLAGSYVHAAAWGDVNGDGRLDLFVGTFASDRGPDGTFPPPSRLLLGTANGLVPSGQSTIEVPGRAAGAVLADLDGDGDLDLMVSNNRVVRDNSNPVELEPHHLYRNDSGTFVDVSDASGIRVADRNGRAIGVLDYDGDADLDLFVVADSLTGTGTRVSRLLQNTGGLRFQDATAAVGLPTDRAGLGVAIGDANGDSWPDLLTTGGTSASGSYAGASLFVNNRNGTFREATTPNLAWAARGGEDWTAGAAWGDLDRDGRLDLVVTHHFASAATTPLAPRVYLNRGNDPGGAPILEEVVDTGIAPVASKAPHLEIRDLDDDGWLDLYGSVRLHDDADRARPLVYRNLGVVDGKLRFASPADMTVRHYAPGGPTADVDGDGRLDVLLEGLALDEPPALLRNTTTSGHWLDVTVAAGANTAGIGARVAVYRAGGLRRAEDLLGTAAIETGNGFASASPAVAHFGLGTVTSVDLEVSLPASGPVLTRTGVAVDQSVRVS